jgi:hypothetical protein
MARIPVEYATALAEHEADRSKNAPGTIGDFTTCWLGKHAPKRVRSKPYSLAEAADVCAELARKAGWQHVRVDELLRG